MKVTQKEFDSLKNRYNKVRSLCDSYLEEIKELKQTVTKLKIELEIDACLQRYRFSVYVDKETLMEQEKNKENAGVQTRKTFSNAGRPKGS